MLCVTEGSSQWLAARCLRGGCILAEVLFRNAADAILGSDHTLDHFPAQNLMWKGGRKNPSHPELKIISEGWRQSRGDASCLLEQLINLRSPESQFHPIFSLSFCLPYLLFPPPGHAGETSQIKLGKLWVPIIYSPARGCSFHSAKSSHWVSPAD